MSPQTFIRDGCLTSTKLLSIQEDKRLNLFDMNRTQTGRLTGCPARVVSPSCPIFPPPHLTVVGFCAVLDRTRWHGSQFRHGDDQIPSGGSFRAVQQQHSIFDLRVRCCCARLLPPEGGCPAAAAACCGNDGLRQPHPRLFLAERHDRDVEFLGGGADPHGGLRRLHEPQVGRRTPIRGGAKGNHRG
jgi:hypothetical protein